MPQSIENILHRRVNAARGVFAYQKLPQLQVVVLLYLVGKQGVPFVSYVHHGLFLLFFVGILMRLLGALGLHR